MTGLRQDIYHRISQVMYGLSVMFIAHGLIVQESRLLNCTLSRFALDVNDSAIENFRLLEDIANRLGIGVYLVVSGLSDTIYW